jgi:hypothetical protein
MSFILGDQRETDSAGAFQRYREYLEREKERFPPGALELARSDWYFKPEDHRCPHDAWLQHFIVQEIGEGERHERRRAVLSVQLLGAYHDLILTFTYGRVRRYSFQGADVRAGHSDWRYDEFRVGEERQLIHEVEWCGGSANARWLVEADDVRMEWSPLARGV